MKKLAFLLMFFVSVTLGAFANQSGDSGDYLTCGGQVDIQSSVGDICYALPGIEFWNVM